MPKHTSGNRMIALDGIFVLTTFFFVSSPQMVLAKEVGDIQIKNSTCITNIICSPVKIWFECSNPNNVPCMDVPCLFRVYPCQEHLLASSNDNFMVQADLVFRIRNDSTYWFRFGKELQMCGYYNLEIDMRLSDGNIFHLKRKDGIWYRNFIEEESIRGEKEYRCLVSLDRRLWNGMPPSFINKVVEVRPRFAFFYFEKEGRRYKSIDDMKSNVETRTWNHSRIGELIGDWCKTPVSPHMSAQ